MSASSSRICFNSECREVKFERLRHGWRLRNGELSELCERCASLFEEGRFCETFHTNATGWRSCESCGKQVHCGCIVSLHAFMLLDAGGIECIQCARKNLILMSSPPWPHPSSHLPVSCDGFKDLCVKWSQIAGAGPIPWRQAPNLFNTSIAQPHRVPHEVELPTDTERCKASERLSLSSLEKRRSEDIHDKFMNGVLKLGAAEELDKGSAGMKLNEQLSSPVNIRQFPAGKDDSSTPHIGLAGPNALQNVKNGQTTAPATHMRPKPSPLPSLSKQFHNSANNGVDSCGEIQMRNGRPRGDGRGKNQLLSRYLPRITDQELQKISGDSSSLITPLFEKMLSASDAGRIGRLVLPKKCAEAYFPQISQPEGLPLKVQDAKGQEWIFQFRFWPNNNSRMYVLEGVTPCIQSMQLQAGDTVTFSRLEPAGKLIMGFRKASVAPCDQGNQTNKDSNGVTSLGDGDARDPVNTQSKFDKPGDITKEATGTKALVPRKRKSGILGSKTKRHKVENMDLIELKITWDEAQTLLRPPTNHVPTVVIIEGFQFEEYEDAPVIGKPSFLANDHSGEKIQWVQCEDCFKWRKLPSDALLPFKWACSENLWDSARSSCSAAQELTEEQLVKLLSASNPAASKKMKAAKQDPDIEEALEGLDTLANLAIMEEGGEASAQAATTKHPRHRPGCSCIVCIQPPSGKGPKHLQSCTCNVCLTVRRRFRTLMMRRERKQTEKEAETARKNKREQSESPENDDSLLYTDMGNSSSDQKEAGNEGSDNDPKSKRGKSMDSPFKGQIDLNMQPEREEELSPSSDSGSMMRLLQDATDRYLRQQRLLSSRTTLTGERDEGQVSRERVCDSVIHGNSLDADLGQPVTL